MPVKMSVNLPDDAVESLREIASKNQLTLTAALRQAITNERFLDSELSDGSKLLIEKPDRSIRQVVFSK